MRKVLEITFASPEFRCVTVNGPDAALQKVRTEKPDIVIADLSLDPKNGYELCRSIKQIAPDVGVILLSSKHNPFDAGKGAAVQADDHMDKPFDTTQFLDKVKKVLESKGVRVAAGAPAPPARQSAPGAAPQVGAVAAARGKTLIYNTPGIDGPVGAGALAAAKGTMPSPGQGPGLAPTPVTGVPLQQQPRSAFTQTTPSAQSPLGASRPAPAAPPPAPAPPAASPPITSASSGAHVNGQMAARLEQMGLTPTQIDGVLALSRDVVERVVWEVVPVLA